MMLPKILHARIWAFAIISLVGCRQRSEGSDPSAQQFARRILGNGVDYRSAEMKAAELKESVAKRRAAAWKVVEETLKPTEIDLGAEFGTRKLAAWQTWYDRTEFQRLFDVLYRCELKPEEREAFKDTTKPFVVAPERVAKVIKEFPRQDLGTAWTEGRFKQLLAQLKTANDLAGLNGVDGTGMSLYSPALVAHYMENGAAVYACDGSVEPPPAEGDVIGDCFGKEFPPNAVAVKPTFNRVQSGAMAFDTSAAGMARIFQSPPPGRNMWRAAASPTQQVIGLDGNFGQKIYRVNYRQGDSPLGEYALTGMHITTKEIPEWMWVSLWWSPEPGKDFGADRPADFASKVDSVYANYKMCVASTYEEGDPLVLGAKKNAGELPADLLASMKATYKFMKPATWCSNPFIEHMAHGAKTNCIGCHQHGGPDGIDTPTAAKPSDLLKVGRRFPGDYMASFSGGKDDFQGLIQEVVSNVEIEGEEIDRSVCLDAPLPE